MKKGSIIGLTVVALLVIGFCLAFYLFDPLPMLFPAAARPAEDLLSAEEEALSYEEVINETPDPLPQEQVPDNAQPEEFEQQPPQEVSQENSTQPLWDPNLVEELSFLQSPLPGAKVTSRDSQLPGAPRAYRNGTHEGLDYYDGSCGISVRYDDPIFAAGDGIIQRIDHHYIEFSDQERAEVLRVSAIEQDTPAHYLDMLRGRQVWILHPNGVITVYAHLSQTADLQEGDSIVAGDIIGFIGNSGTSDGVLANKNGAHLHFEVWLGDKYLGEDLPPGEVRKLLKEILE
jgi:murein DD-endopeptidase MepM/ murein hydrolase activator NlpD